MDAIEELKEDVRSRIALTIESTRLAGVIRERGHEERFDRQLDFSRAGVQLRRTART